jgi:hypothetical protein
VRALNLPLSPEKREFWRVPIPSCWAQATWQARYRQVPNHPPGVSDSIEPGNGIEVTRRASEVSQRFPVWVSSEGQRAGYDQPT